MFTIIVGSFVGSFVVTGALELDSIQIFASAFAVLLSAAVIFTLRGRTLLVRDDSVIIQRDRAMITLAWSDFVGVTQRSWGPMTIDTLEFTGGLMIPEDPYRGFSPGMEKRLRKERADRAFEPGMYFADWRASELGSVVVTLRK
ncbi:hypothetical protein [Actinokineospora sp.]|uniref:hypothetical protein n=1 Tax=Actinokineospora sp. TaxID=1872133 RepID=UPI003D6C6943